MTLKRFLIVSASTLAAGAFAAMPVFAQTTIHVSTHAPLRIHAEIQGHFVTRVKDRANQEIDRRINGLNRLLRRANAMTRVSAVTKSNLASTVKSQVEALTALKSKIDASTDLATLRADVHSITKSYRIYALIIPQGAVLVATDRLTSVADTMTSIGNKLQSRVAEAQAAGKDVTVLQSAYDDYMTKVSDAKTQVSAVISATAALQPDSGDHAVKLANRQSMEVARSKIHSSIRDLVSARKDAAEILGDFRFMHLDARVSQNTDDHAVENDDHAIENTDKEKEVETEKQDQPERLETPESSHESEGVESRSTNDGQENGDSRVPESNQG